jgi:hypothetical protein
MKEKTSEIDLTLVGKTNVRMWTHTILTFTSEEESTERSGLGRHQIELCFWKKYLMIKEQT